MPGSKKGMYLEQSNLLGSLGDDLEGLAYFTALLQARRFCLLRAVRPGDTLVLEQRRDLLFQVYFFP